MAWACFGRSASDRTGIARGRLVLLDDQPAWRPGTAWYLVHADRPVLAAFADWLLRETAGPMP